MKPPFVRTEYNYDMNAETNRTGLACKDKSLAQQEFVEESDINYIAERYGLTGEMPQVRQLPAYGDFTGIFDFQTAQNAVRQALEQFMTLPAKMRARFNNDPQQLLGFLEDPDNRKEAIAIGLLDEPKPEAVPEPSPAPVPPSTGPGKAPAGKKPTPPKVDPSLGEE